MIYKIETDKWEDLKFQDEPNKRSVQFRVLADKVNEVIDELNNRNSSVVTIPYEEEK